MQTIILICLVIWTLEPTQNLALIIGVGLAIAISSATQDITIDALRIEQIKRDETSRWLQVRQWQLLMQDLSKR